PRYRLAAHRVADQARRTPREELQVFSAPPPDTEPGLVQSVPGPYADRSRAQSAHTRRARTRFDVRRAGARLVEAAMNERTGEVENAGMPEWEDMQVLLRFGLGHLTHASFLLLRVKNRDAARAWLAAAPVTNAVATDPPPMTALQVALTSD